MQDTLDITGVAYEYDLIWLHTGYSILVQWKNTTQVYNSGVTDGVQGWEPLPWQVNAKTDPPFCLYFGIQYFLVFSKLLFFAFFGSFWTVVFRWFRALVYRNPHPDKLSFLNFFLNVGGGPLRLPVGLFQLRFPPWLKPLARQLVHNLIFLNNVLLSYTKNACNQRGFSRRYLHNNQLAKATLTTKLFTMHLAMVGFGKLWVVWRLIYLRKNDFLCD